MNVRRLAFVFTAVPLAFYAYACSSDPEVTPGEDAGPEGGTNPDPIPDPDKDSGNPAKTAAAAPTAVKAASRRA